MFKKRFAFALLALALSFTTTVFAADDTEQRQARIKGSEQCGGLVVRVVNRIIGSVRTFSDLLTGPRP